MIDELELLREQTNDKARDIARKYGMLQESNYSIFDLKTYKLGNTVREGQRRKIERELRTEKDNKIAQIILDLELGETTKKELNDVLVNVNF